MHDIAVTLYEHFHKVPVDTLPYETEKFVNLSLKLFIEDTWYVVYDIVEFLYSAFVAGSLGQQHS